MTVNRAGIRVVIYDWLTFILTPNEEDMMNRISWKC